MIGLEKHTSIHTENIVCFCSEESTAGMFWCSISEEGAVTVYRLVRSRLYQAVHQWMYEATDQTCLCYHQVTGSWLFPHPSGRCGGPTEGCCSYSVHPGSSADK